MPALPPSHRKPRSEDLTWAALTHKHRVRHPQVGRQHDLWARRSNLPSARPAATALRTLLHVKLLASLTLIVVPIVHSALSAALGQLMEFSGPISWLCAALLSAPVIKPLFGWVSRVLNP